MRSFRKRKLKVDILTAFSLLMCITIACEIFYSAFANKKIVLQFEKDYYSKKISEIAAKWFDSYFNEVETVAKILSKSAEKTDVFEKTLIESVQRIPFALSFYVAFKNGEYIQARTTYGLKTMQTNIDEDIPSHSVYAVKKIDALNDVLTESWKYLNEDLEPIKTETLHSVSYDSRKRDWYIKAESKQDIVWSDVYLFSTTKLPGITVSCPVDTGGVLAVDFALSKFKELLQGAKITPNSIIYLVNPKNDILSSTTDIMIHSKTEEMQTFPLHNIDSVDDPIVKVATRELIGKEEQHANFCVNNIDYVASVQKLQKLPISLLIITPQSDFTASFDNVQRSMLYISIAIFIIALGVIVLLSRRISQPIIKLCNSANAIGKLDLKNYPEPPKSNIIEIQNLSDSMNTMKLGVSTFAKYAPKELVKKLIKYGIEPELGGQIKRITMLFSDIEKFSTIAERLPSEYLVLHLSEYFDELTKTIMSHDGIIDKYIGDSIMALWGAPNPDEDQVVHACRAAIECQNVLEQLKDKWTPLGKPALPTRIGIHTGSVIVGNMGSEDRMNYTAIGDAVNIASRLEGANKVYGTKILVSEDVEKEARGKFLFRIIDRIAVKGRTSGIKVFEPLCDMKTVDETIYYSLIDLSSKSKEAFELYEAGTFSEAIKLYKEICKMSPDNALSIEPLIKRCQDFEKNPPEDWDGIYRLKTK